MTQEQKPMSEAGLLAFQAEARRLQDAYVRKFKAQRSKYGLSNDKLNAKDR